MILYNSLGQTKQEFVPHTPGKVNMYTCGPTVYHYAHIGNLRTYIMEDVLEKYLRFSGYDTRKLCGVCGQKSQKRSEIRLGFYPYNR